MIGACRRKRRRVRAAVRKHLKRRKKYVNSVKKLYEKKEVRYAAADSPALVEPSGLKLPLSINTFISVSFLFRTLRFCSAATIGEKAGLERRKAADAEGAERYLNKAGS